MKDSWTSAPKMWKLYIVTVGFSKQLSRRQRRHALNNDRCNAFEQLRGSHVYVAKNFGLPPTAQFQESIHQTQRSQRKALISGVNPCSGLEPFWASNFEIQVAPRAADRCRSNGFGKGPPFVGRRLGVWLTERCENLKWNLLIYLHLIEA